MIKYSLEDLFDKQKFASLDVAIHYGDNLLKNVNEISKQLQIIAKEANQYDFSEKMLQAIQDAKLELRMVQIAIGDMQNYLIGYKEKMSPSKTEDISATEGFDFTEEELKRLEELKQQHKNYTSGEGSALEISTSSE